MPRMNSFSRLVWPLLLVLACVVVYYPGLSGGFLFDDFPNIVTNARLHAQSLDAESLARAAQAYEPGLYGRPLATLGFAVDHYLGGKAPWGYKVHSLIVHVANALLVLLLMKRLLAMPGAGGAWPAWSAAAFAAAWAIHPLQASTVLYVVQRMEMLSVTFVLLGLLAYLRGREAQRDGRTGWTWLAGSAGLAGIGMLGKETAALFPLFTLAIELTLLDFQARDAKTSRFLKRAYAAGALVATLVFSLWLLPRYLAPEAYALRDFTLQERLLTQLRVLPMYLGQMVLPLPDSLPFYYDAYPKSTGWLSPSTTVAGAVFLAALMGAAWGLRKRVPLASLGILWFFAAHALSSNVINLELAFEHRNYFALLGVLLALAALLRHIPTSDQSAARLAAGAMLLGLAVLCAIRTATWGHPLILATDLVARSPLSPRASSDLATLYIGLSDSNPDSPFFDFGRKEFERGSRLPNASPLPEQGLILMAATTGQPVDPAWWDRLIEKVRTRPLGPQEVSAVTGLMKQRQEGIELDDARLAEAYGVLLARDGAHPVLFLQFADFALTRLGDQALATRTYVAALDGPGMDRELALRIVTALEQDGREPQARAVFERAIAMGLIEN